MTKGMKASAALAALCALGLLNSAARAEECRAGALNVSCHRTQPNKDQVSMGPTVPLGTYTPFIWREGHARVEPPANPGNNATGTPGIDITLGAGGWGESSNEPMAIARTTVSILVAEGVYGFFEPTPGLGLNFGCPDGPVLCGDDASASSLLQTAVSAIYRRYRVRQINPATLPPSVDFVPIKLDYRLGIFISGNSDFAPGYREGLTSSVSISFSSTATSSGRARAECSGGSTLTCSVQGGTFAPIDGKVQQGTLSYRAPRASLDRLMLSLNVGNFIERGKCRDVMTPEGTYCLIKPWHASGHGVADPYVYIDPSWEYASWFVLEMSADETDTNWVTPTRTNVDLENLTGLVEADGGVATGDAGVAADDAGEQPGDDDAAVAEEEDAGEVGGQPRRDAGAGGDDDEEDPEPSKKGGGGCQLAAGADPLAGALLLLAGLALVRRRRRSR